MSHISHPSFSTRWGRASKDGPLILVEVNGSFEYRKRNPKTPVEALPVKTVKAEKRFKASDKQEEAQP